MHWCKCQPVDMRGSGLMHLHCCWIDNCFRSRDLHDDPATCMQHGHLQSGDLRGRGSCAFTAVGSTTAFEAATCTTTPIAACGEGAAATSQENCVAAVGRACSWDSGTSTCAEIDQDTACNAAAADQATCEAAGTTAGDCTWTAEIAAVPATASCALIDQDAACSAAVADQGTCEAAGAAAGDCTWTAEVAAVPATASCALTVEDLCWDPTSPSSTNVFRYYPPFILDNLGSTLTDKLAGGELLTISGGGLLHPTLRGVYSCSQDMIDAGECSELSDPYVNGIASTDFQALASEQADGIAPLRCRFSPLTPGVGWAARRAP